MRHPIYRRLQAIRAKKTYEDLYVRDVKNKSYIRVGNNSDGGYVMLDDFDGIDGVLSFGVGMNITWEEDIADTGVIVEMYDPTVEKVNLSKDNLFFYQIGVGKKKNIKKKIDTLKYKLHNQ